jgi:hypothetical protein
MGLVPVSGERERRNTVAKVIERVRPRYEGQDVQFGKVYKWQPERIVVECGCGERFSLSASSTTCARCGTDHGSFLQDELSDLQPRGDEG